MALFWPIYNRTKRTKKLEHKIVNKRDSIDVYSWHTNYKNNTILIVGTFMAMKTIKE